MSVLPLCLSFADYHAEAVSEELLVECAALFSSSYGVWEEKGFRPGHRVQLSPERLRAQSLFDSDTCRLAVARDITGKVAGQAFYCMFLHEPTGKWVTWVTQLVVSPQYRGCHVARTMLLQPCGHKDLFACGLASSHPYAVRALESAARMKCNIALTARHAADIISASCIPYLQNRGMTVCTGSATRQSVIATDFLVDHTEADVIRATLKGWNLGDLPPGAEFLAIVFL